MNQAGASVDLDRLLRLRLVVARFGEMDVARWWNTKGQLGHLGTATLRRGFPRTHYSAQARSVFAVAGHRCREIFEPPGCVSLWHLTEVIEDEFDARWGHFIDHAIDWEPFFQELQGVSGSDLLDILRSFELVTEHDLDGYAGLRRSAEGRAVQLPGLFSGSAGRHRPPCARLCPGRSRQARSALPAEGGYLTLDSRAHIVSSFTVIKGAMLEETYAVFSAWDFDRSKRENLDRLREENFIGAKSATWLRDVAKVLNRRFEPDGRDRALVVLAKGECDIEEWKPLLLWHMTRDEFLLHDFLENWLFSAYDAGAFPGSSR